MPVSGYGNLCRQAAGEGFEVFTGLCESRGNEAVVIEILTGLSERSIFLLNQKVDIFRGLSSQNIVDFLDFNGHQTGKQEKAYIIYEKARGQALKGRLNGKPLPVGDCIRIALGVCSGLTAIHEAGMTHEALYPGNITVRSRKPFAVISGFDFGRRFSSGEGMPFFTPIWFDFLPYMSPEHTGRINSPLDHTSDLYCLGAILYQCLTGKPPFMEDDPQKLIHAHLAAAPTPPCTLGPDIPGPLSDIVMKLLEKAPDQRYQTCHGLKADLKRCETEWRNSGAIAPFTLCRKDVPRKLKIPDRLYGRDKETDLLRQALKRIRTGTREMILVSGFSGIGKTALVQESVAATDSEKTLFISGKFDQYTRNVPYSAIAQAIHELTMKILADSGKTVANVQESLTTELEANARLIADMVPEVEQLTGPLPPLPELGPVETANRFNRTVPAFLRFFCRPDCPLVLFLDDLQWADQSSLTLLRSIMSDVSLNHLLLIGAYRDNEVGPDHPLINTLEEIEGERSPTLRLTLAPLSARDVRELIADTFRLGKTTVSSLSNLLEQKTGGNPFFLRELLKSLHEDKLLEFRLSENAWNWNIKSIQEQVIATDIVDFVSERMQQLPLKTRKALRLAACLGNRFDLGTLALLLKSPVYRAAILLQGTVASGALTSLGESIDIDGGNIAFATRFMFAHDRIQQAFYAMIPEAEKPALHLDIGRKLQAGLPAEIKETRAPDIAAHMNQGLDLIKTKKEKMQLAELNLQAGRMSRRSAAFETGFSFLMAGVKTLPPGAWQEKYGLALSLHLEAAEAAYLCGKYDFMEDLAETILANAVTVVDKARIYTIKVQAEIARGQLNNAIEIGAIALNFLGIHLPENPGEAEAGREIAQTMELLARHGIENLPALPRMKDRKHLSAMGLLQMMSTAALFTSPLLLSVITCNIVRLSIRQGNSLGSVFGYGFLASILICTVDDRDTAYHLSVAALDIGKASGEMAEDAISCFFYEHYVRHWKKHPDPWPDIIRSFVPRLIALGNFEYAAYFLACSTDNDFFIGKNLSVLHKRCSENVQTLKSLNQDVTVYHHTMLHLAVINLVQKVKHPTVLGEDTLDEKRLFKAAGEKDDVGPFWLAYCYKTILSIIFCDGKGANHFAHETKKYITGANNALIHMASFRFFYCLARLAVYGDSEENEKNAILEDIAALQEKMKKWAADAPMNFLHKYHLVEAEKCRILGYDWQAMEHYDRAICGAAENGYTHEEALANEMAARFYLGRGRKSLASSYMTVAREAYVRWGAAAKVAHIEENWPELLLRKHLESTPPSAAGPVRQEDLNSVVRAAHLISEEKDLANLLNGLMEIVMVNAGAARGFLILETADAFIVQARVDTEKFCQDFVPVVLEDCPDLPHGIIYYVARTDEIILLDNAAEEGIFTTDSFIRKNKIKSVLCFPIIDKGKLTGILYLENNHMAGVFSEHRVDILQAVANILASVYARDMAEKELLERQAGLRDLTARLSLVEERERRRISEELHERIGHGLAEIGIKLDTLKAQYRPSWKNRPLVKETRALVTRAMEDARSLIFEISPPVLYDLGLADALEWLAEEMAKRYGLKTAFKGDFMDTFLPEDLRVFLFQAARELLFNSHKHAGDTQAEISIVYENGNIQLMVKDNGRGFKPENQPDRKFETKGFGLFSIRERVTLLGGQMDIQSAPRKGTCVSIVIPLESTARRK